MYSVKIKNNIQNLFSVLDNTVPGSSPYAVNKTISNSDTGFTLNTFQSIVAPSISLIQGSSSERFTIGTSVTSGTYRYVWFFRSSDYGTIRRQIANISFSNGFTINSLPANSQTTGYVSYNHPDSSVYTGSMLVRRQPLGDDYSMPITITVFDTNSIQSASSFTCTQIGVLFLAYSSNSSVIGLVSLSTLVNVGDSLLNVVNDLISSVGDSSSWSSLDVTEITYLPSSTITPLYSNNNFAVVYSTAIFSIN